MSSIETWSVNETHRSTVLGLENSKEVDVATTLESTILIPEDPKNQGRLEQDQTNLKTLFYLHLFT